MKNALVILSVIAALMLQSSHAAEDKKPEVLVLSQTCANMHVSPTIFLTPDGMRIENADVVSFSKAPDWDYVIMNRQGKVYFRTGYGKGLENLKNMAINLPEDVAGEFRWTKKQGAPLSNLPTNDWTKPGKTNKMLAQLRTISPGIVDVHCARLLAASYGIPCPGGELPLSFVFYGQPENVMPTRHYEQRDKRSIEQRWLQTISIKRVARGEDLFSIPKNYTRTKNVMMAMRNVDLSRKDNYVIKELLKDPGALFQSQ